MRIFLGVQVQSEMEFEQNLHTSLQDAQPQLPRGKKNLGTLESLRVSLLVITHTFMSEALLGFEQAWTPILYLTAPLCKLLALRDLSASTWPSSVLSQICKTGNSRHAA